MGQYLVRFSGLPQNAMLRAGLFITMLNALQVPAVLQTKYGENGTGLISQHGDWKGLEKPSQVLVHSCSSGWRWMQAQGEKGTGCVHGSVAKI